VADYFRKEALPGVFIIAAGLFLMILLFSIHPRGAGGGYEIKVVFDNIAGLKESASVWFLGVEKYQGLEIGKVKTIKIINGQAGSEYKIEVTLKINKVIPLKEGTRFRIASQGLAGYPHIEILPGPVDGKDIPHDKPLRGNTPPNDMFTTLQELSDIVKAMELEKLTPEIKRTVVKFGDFAEELEVLTSDFAEIVKEIKEKDDIPVIVANVRTVSEKAVLTVDRTNKLVSKIDGVIDENRSEIKSIISNFAEFSAKMGPQFSETVSKIDALITGIDTFLKENKEEISAIFVNLRATTQNTKLFTQDIKLNPWKLLKKSKEKKPVLKPELYKGPKIK